MSLSKSKDYIRRLPRTADEPDAALELQSKRLQQTFGRVIPNLKVKNGLVAFFCKAAHHFQVYSILDGDMVVETVGAQKLIEATMMLKKDNIPVHVVDERMNARILSAFKHIRQMEGERKRFAQEEHPLHSIKKDLEKLKTDIASTLV